MKRYAAFAYNEDDSAAPAAAGRAEVMLKTDSIPEARAWATARFAADEGRYVSRVRIYDAQDNPDFDRGRALEVIERPWGAR